MGLRTRDVLGRVMRGGLRLPRTTYMSDTLYQLMLSCWMSDPDERPDFAAVNATLRDIVSDPEQVDQCDACGDAHQDPRVRSLVSRGTYCVAVAKYFLSYFSGSPELQSLSRFPVRTIPKRARNDVIQYWWNSSSRNM